MDLLTPQEVAQAFRVDPKTVRLWAQEGRLRWVRTLGGHRRYFKADVQRLLTEPGRWPHEQTFQ
ncbi:BldC family transcriptional regulator [Nocardiopsis alba]